MQRKAALYLLSLLVGLSVVAAGCANEETPAAGGEFATQGATVVSGASKVTLCNLPRYTKQITVRLCGYVTPGSDGSAVASAWFSVDGGAAINVVPGSGGFVDTSTSLAEGAHAIRLYAQSAAGNLTFEEKPVTEDLSPPVLKVLAPTPADVMTSTVVNVTSSVTDATPVRVQTQWVQSSTVDSGTGTVTHTVDLVNRGYNTLLVRATDAVGNTSEARVTVYFCPSSDAACFASAHWAPVIVSTSQSATTVPASGGVTLSVVASDPQSSSLSFSWTANLGSLGVPTSGAGTSEVVWTPACMPTGTTPSITVTVTNALGASVSQSFTVTGVSTCASQTVPLAAGYSHTLALRRDGTVWAWGRNDFGQLGDGTTTNHLFPVKVPGLSGAIALSAGDRLSVALLQDGTVWTWGQSALSPMQVPSISSATAISARANHTVALSQDGTVWAWGQNTHGQLGDGTTTSRQSPVQVPGLSGVTAIAAGGVHTLALRRDGTVWAWGQNNYGQLGDGTTTERYSPVRVPGLSGVTALAAGYFHTLALCQDGTVWAWGQNNYGQLGDGTTTQRNSPVQVPGLSHIAATYGGGSHTVARRQDGTVWAWGQNVDGQLGDGTTTQRNVPVQVPGLSSVTTITVGSYHTLALRQDGTAWAWGWNSFGQLGDGMTTNRLSPVQVPVF